MTEGTGVFVRLPIFSVYRGVDERTSEVYAALKLHDALAGEYRTLRITQEHHPIPAMDTIQSWCGMICTAPIAPKVRGDKLYFNVPRGGKVRIEPPNHGENGAAPDHDLAFADMAEVR